MNRLPSVRPGPAATALTVATALAAAMFVLPPRAALADTLFLSSLNGSGTVRADFNGDGFDDLAIGVPLEDLGAITEAGQVTVVYGSAAGLNTATAQVWNQNVLLGTPEDDDEFGTALAGGDFNGDGFDDLAVGACFEDGAAGAVHMILGTANGLTATGNKLFQQGIGGIGGGAETGDNFGCSLAAGDFNGDNRDDLAVGAFGEAVGNDDQAGAVNVIYGAAGGGLSATGNQVFTEGSSGIGTLARPGDIFGAALAAGDFNGDGRDDLAVSAPGEDLGTFGQFDNAGIVHAIYGTASGLSGSGEQVWSQNHIGIQDDPDDGEFFGFAVAAGDFNGDGRDDLAVGVPFENVNLFSDKPNAGAVNIILGSSGKLTNNGNYMLSQDEAGSKEGPSDANDQFGRSLTVGDFDGNGRDDLAVGVRLEDVIVNNATAVDTGLVEVYYGAVSNVNLEQSWHQSQPGIDDICESNDTFGSALTAGDYNGDNRDDLAIGVPGEDVAVTDEGAVTVIYGSPARLTATGNQFLSQDALPDSPEAIDRFGFQLG